MTKWDYIELIAQRGDQYGGAGGAYDLLLWCRKRNTASVTQDEARRFFENPDAPYDNDEPSQNDI